MENLLTVKEAAERLGINVGSLYHWLSQGRIPCVRFSARCVRFRESDLARLVDQLSCPGRTEHSVRENRTLSRKIANFKSTQEE